MLTGRWCQLGDSRHTCTVAECNTSSKRRRRKKQECCTSKKEHHCAVAWSPIPFQAALSPPVLASRPAPHAEDPGIHSEPQPQAHSTISDVSSSFTAVHHHLRVFSCKTSTQPSFAQTARSDLWLVMCMHATHEASSPLPRFHPCTSSADWFANSLDSDPVHDGRISRYANDDVALHRLLRPGRSLAQ